MVSTYSSKSCVGAHRGPESSLKAVRCIWFSKRYLLRNFIVGYVSFDSEWPFEMKRVLVQLHQEYNEHKKGIDHKEGKYR